MSTYGIETHTTATTERPTSEPRVLLVDDDEDYTEFVMRLLTRMGHAGRLHMVHDEESALKAIQEGQYDVVVSDYELQPGCGIRVLEHVSKQQPGAQRILLTSAPDKAQAEMTTRGEVVHDVWDKRWELGTIRSQLESILKPSQ